MMPSPFPGMDPYFEGQIWDDFHATLICEMRAVLVAALVPRYVARIHLRTYLERLGKELA